MMNLMMAFSDLTMLTRPRSECNMCLWESKDMSKGPEIWLLGGIRHKNPIV